MHVRIMAAQFSVFRSLRGCSNLTVSSSLFFAFMLSLSGCVSQAVAKPHLSMPSPQQELCMHSLAPVARGS